MSRVSVICPDCHAENTLSSYFSFRADCEKCSADLHVCLTCQFYDRYADNQCKESQAEYIANKSKSNLCDFWRPQKADSHEATAAEQAKEKLNAAFGLSAQSAKTAADGASDNSMKDDAMKKLEALFKK